MNLLKKFNNHTQLVIVQDYPQIIDKTFSFFSLTKIAEFIYTQTNQAVNKI